MRLIIFCFILVFSSVHICAQEYVSENAPMRVIHCSAISQDQNVKNIFVDENNVKWAATEDKIYRINSADNSTPKELSKNQWSLLMQPEGNGLLNLNKFDLEKLPENPESITCAFYDENRKILYVGTESKGVLVYKTSPEVKLINKYSSNKAGEGFDLSLIHI